MNYTKGPWTLNEYKDCITDGNAVLAERPHGNTADWETNAQLMTSAPNMYEALKEVTVKLEDMMTKSCHVAGAMQRFQGYDMINFIQDLAISISPVMHILDDKIEG